MSHPPDYEKIKNEIIKASDDVFMKFGLDKVSMNEISKASGKGRTTLYYYFKNKNEVLEAFAAEKFSELLNKSQKDISPHQSFIQNIEAYYKTKLGLFRKILKQYSTLVEDIKADPAIWIQKSRLFFKEETDIVGKILEWAIERKEITSLTIGEIKFFAALLVTAFRSFEQEILLFGGLEDFESKLNWLTQILFKGLV